MAETEASLRGTPTRNPSRIQYPALKRGLPVSSTRFAVQWILLTRFKVGSFQLQDLLSRSVSTSATFLDWESRLLGSLYGMEPGFPITWTHNRSHHHKAPDFHLK